MPDTDNGSIRNFDTGATRDTTEGKIDMEGFTHPMVMKQFAKYMNMTRVQSDGNLRDSDNWQKGIPLDVYMKSLTRHKDDVWQEHRGFSTDMGLIGALCGLMFNTMGYLFETLKARDFKLQDFDGREPTPEMAERLLNLPEPGSDDPAEEEQVWVEEAGEISQQAIDDLREWLKRQYERAVLGSEVITKEYEKFTGDYARCFDRCESCRWVDVDPITFPCAKCKYLGNNSTLLDMYIHKDVCLPDPGLGCANCKDYYKRSDLAPCQECARVHDSCTIDCHRPNELTYSGPNTEHLH